MSRRYVRKCFLVFVGYLLVCLMVVCVASAAAGDGGSSVVEVGGQGSVSLAPAHTFMSVSDICTLSVCVEGVGDSLGCIECWVSFDTTLVELISAEEGHLFEQAPCPRFFLWVPIAPDTHSVEGCLLGYDTYTLTPGEVARYVFRALDNGICPVRITRLNLFDIDRVMYQPVMDPNAWIVIGPATGVRPAPAVKVGLSVHPNPFNPSTRLVFTPPAPVAGGAYQKVSIEIFTPDGKLLRTLFEGTVGSDAMNVDWDGKNRAGADVSSGVYFAAARMEQKTFRTKLVLIR